MIQFLRITLFRFRINKKSACHLWTRMMICVSILSTNTVWAQTLRVCYIPNSRATFGDNGYTLDGDKMVNHATPKLLNSANFGPNGIVKRSIVTVPLTDKPITTNTLGAAGCGAIFVGGFPLSWDGSTLKGSSITDAELAAIKTWSTQALTNLVVVTQTETTAWSYTNVNGNSNPNRPTAAGSATRIFNGPFGNVTSFGQGGGYQGSLAGGTSTVLAQDNTGRATIALDIPTGDIILGDVDILTELGGISSGGNISNNNDRLFANIWAYATDLTSTDRALVATSNTVFLDGGIGGGTANNCNRDGTESLQGIATPLYAKLVSGTAVTQVSQVQADGSFSFTSVPDGNYTLFIDDNSLAADLTPLARSGTLSWTGTIISGRPSTPVKFCLTPACPAAAGVTAAGPTNIVSGGSVVLTTPTVAGQTYQWNKDGTLISGAVSNTYTANQQGSYSVTVTREGCSITSSVTTVNIILADEPVYAGFKLNTYPIPADGEVTIQIENEVSKPIQLQLFNPAGQLVQTWDVTASVNRQTLTARLSAAGLYVLRADNGRGVIRRKIVRK